MSQAGAYGVKPGQKSTGAIGASLQLDFDKAFYNDKITYRTYFYAFSNYNSNRNAYINWKNTVQFKIFKFMFQPRCSVLPYTTKQPVLRKDGNGYR
ncbi:MAG: hypothetical protein ACLR8Y_22360 [Alistipes indistinctus]